MLLLCARASESSPGLSPDCFCKSWKLMRLAKKKSALGGFLRRRGGGCDVVAAASVFSSLEWRQKKVDFVSGFKSASSSDANDTHTTTTTTKHTHTVTHATHRRSKASTASACPTHTNPPPHAFLNHARDDADARPGRGDARLPQGRRGPRVPGAGQGRHQRCVRLLALRDVGSEIHSCKRKKKRGKGFRRRENRLLFFLRRPHCRLPLAPARRGTRTHDARSRSASCECPAPARRWSTL